MGVQEAKGLHAMMEAYFKTAAKRFIDSCIQDIDRSLLQRSAPVTKTMPLVWLLQPLRAILLSSPGGG